MKKGACVNFIYGKLDVPSHDEIQIKKKKREI